MATDRPFYAGNLGFHLNQNGDPVGGAFNEQTLNYLNQSPTWTQQGRNFISPQQLDQLRAQFLRGPDTYPKAPMYYGKSFIVVCNGGAEELKASATIEEATERAEQLAHQYQSEAFILKPVRKVAPKRDVVTTDL